MIRHVFVKETESSGCCVDTVLQGINRKRGSM